MLGGFVGNACKALFLGIKPHLRVYLKVGKR